MSECCPSDGCHDELVPSIGVCHSGCNKCFLSVDQAHNGKTFQVLRNKKTAQGEETKSSSREQTDISYFMKSGYYVTWVHLLAIASPQLEV